MSLDLPSGDVIHCLNIPVPIVSNCGKCTEHLRYIGLASQALMRGRREPGTHYLHMLSPPEFLGIWKFL